ncbi:eukaryotic aspartyl protease [Colletotrichum tabaci]|uniref:Eukaryotic aspartyl protease n=1 Tax=Colletotrichum tabaci TaxID=1209068 RepID=A0AAV9TGY1_9PEZI
MAAAMKRPETQKKHRYRIHWLDWSSCCQALSTLQTDERRISLKRNQRCHDAEAQVDAPSRGQSSPAAGDAHANRKDELVTRRTSKEPPVGLRLIIDDMLSTTLVASVFAGLVGAQSRAAMALTPSSDWYGVDGNWSTIKLQVGTPGQSVNVLASTSLSELWVIGPGGCLGNESICNARGNIFTIAQSKSWKPLGAWQLGLDYLGYDGNGDYGLDKLSSTLLTGSTMRMDNIITASINSTNFYLGYLGLGITKGSFGNSVADSPLTQAVKNYGWIPSYSYGYTAGAYYMGASGTPCSVTLGGYDASRFVPHNVNFTLDPSDGLPNALVRGIEVSAGQDKALHAGWNTTTRILSNMSTSFSATIDSSTPYLWLPDAVCDQFAEAFNLTYNRTFNLYTVTNEQYADFKSGLSSYSFTFSFTSHDNSNDFGNPLTVPGVVNITITAAAFAQVLRYPFQSETIGLGEPPVPYFPLRRSSNLTDTFIIGRSFLQEAYLITKYDTGVFSLHQALFPDEPLQSLKLKNIAQPNDSPLARPPAQVNSQGGLSAAEMGGVAAGVVAACMIIFACWYFNHRRKKLRATTRALEDGKDAASSTTPDLPKSPVAKMFTKILGRKKTKKASANEAMESTLQPAEMAADANQAVYELPVPVAPVELNGDDGKSVLEHNTVLGTDDTQNIDTYELARRNVEIQLRGPLPAYTPPENPSDFPPTEKVIRDMSPAVTSSPGEIGPVPSSLPASPSSPSSPVSCDKSSSTHGSLPSPMSSRAGEWSNRMSDLSSPSMEAASYHSHTFTVSNAGNTVPQPTPPESETLTSNSSNFSNTSPSTLYPALPASPLPTHQRTLIDSSNVVCLGPLPEHISIPGPRTIPAPLTYRQGSSNMDVVVPQVLDASRVSTDTLGSNWTEFEEELMAQELTGQVTLQESIRNREEESDSLRSLHRLDGSEFIHIPQPAERRYSWEH